jgi:hypothetical protein
MKEPFSEIVLQERTRREHACVAEFVTIEQGLWPEGRIAPLRFDRGDGVNALPAGSTLPKAME